MKLKTEFDKLIKESISDSHIQPNTVYYDDFYEKQLRDELRRRGVLEIYEKRELQNVAKDKVKMCSAASSSRLCFLYFANQPNIRFEYSLTTGTRGIAQLDAFDGLKCYECKCHEIFDNHDNKKNYLRVSYKANLEKYFGLKTIKIEGRIIKLTLKELGINDDSSIYKLHFDVKQFLCHLFGLAHNGGGCLQYIFFTPKNELISSNSECSAFYRTLDEEIDKIWTSPIIQNMLKNNNIKLPKPLKIQVSEIKDFILQK